MVLPMLVDSAIGPQIPGASSLYTYHCIYIRQIGKNEAYDQVTNTRLGLMCDAVDNDPTLNNLDSTATSAGCNVLRCWTESIDLNPEEDKMLSGKLELETDVASFNVVVATKSRL